MTPYDEHGKNFIQVGIGALNKTWDAAQVNYNISYPGYIWDFKVKLKDQSTYEENFDELTPLPDPKPTQYPKIDDNPYEQPELFPDLSKYRYNAGEV
jgi:hypothetical protein